MSTIAFRAVSLGPRGFSFASIWMPLSGSANLMGMDAMARCASVRIGRLARADAPAAYRKNERRERPSVVAGSIKLFMRVISLCEQRASEALHIHPEE